MKWHPVYLALEGRRVVVVGGTDLAILKVRELLELGAVITVIAESPGAELEALARGGRVTLLTRPYREGDLAEAWLVFAATGDAATHARVSAEASQRRVWLNAVDDIPHCSFIAGSVHREGDIVVAVTTGGACPALAVRLRQTIARLIGPEHGRFAALAARLRRRVARRIPDFGRRRRFWYALVDSAVIGAIRLGHDRAARRLAHQLLVRAQRGNLETGSGRAILVGAGPGDPGLITAAGLAWLRAAQVVVHDRLVNPALLREARHDARLIDVGKALNGPSTSQGRIHEILVEEARAGKLVVRLKGGDPFVFGRGAEEVEALNGAGIPVTVVPGVTSAIAGPGAVGIPVTRRGVAAAFAVVTARNAPSAPPLDWAALAAIPTLVVLMGRERLADVAARLIAAGRTPDTPAALIAEATLPNQRALVASLADLPLMADVATIRGPATLIVGDVVRSVTASPPVALTGA